MHLDEDCGYGELSSESVGRIKDIIGQLCGRGYLATSQGQYPVVGLGPRAGEVEDERRSPLPLSVARPSARPRPAPAAPSICCARRPSWISARALATMPSCSSACVPSARRSRPSLEMAPYMVFSDKALRGLCRLRPQTREELIQVNGIGEKKADAFGEQFMAAIEEFESEHARDGA